jgi:hypothetical protein
MARVVEGEHRRDDDDDDDDDDGGSGRIRNGGVGAGEAREARRTLARAP